MVLVVGFPRLDGPDGIIDPCLQRAEAEVVVVFDLSSFAESAQASHFVVHSMAQAVVVVVVHNRWPSKFAESAHASNEGEVVVLVHVGHPSRFPGSAKVSKPLIHRMAEASVGRPRGLEPVPARDLLLQQVSDILESHPGH